MCIEPSLIELLAIRLSPQAGKPLVIPRKRESSNKMLPQSGQCQGVVSLREGCTIDWIPACAGMTKQRGVSLIELIMFIVIMSVAVAGVLLVMNKVTGHSADTLIRKQSLAIAESLLEEVELMPFTYCDPDDANAASAVVATGGCAVAANEENATIGSEAGETRYHATTPFDNVSDYHGFSSVADGGIKDVTGNPISALSGYTASVAIARAGAAFLGVADGAALLITVTVTGPDSISVVLQGYRTRYAPNDLP